MLELNIIALAALVAALAFWAGWRAHARKIPTPAPKRPLGGAAVTGAAAAGLLEVSMTEIGRLVAEGKIRPLPGGLSRGDVIAILAERQVFK